MKFTATRLPDVVVIEPAVFSDERGWFMESFSQKRFADGLAALGLPQPRPFVQDNESQSAQGVLRGLHYQLPPHPQGKLVRVVQGAALDAPGPHPLRLQDHRLLRQGLRTRDPLG